MQLEASTPQSRALTTWLIAVLGFGLLVILILSFAMGQPPVPGDGTGAQARVAYLEFGANADTLYLADPGDLNSREALYDIPHAPEYGIVPAISPAGDRFAYTALEPGLTSPTPQTPAGLWLAGIDAGAAPVLLAEDVDLLVRPLWTPDGAAVVYRRSTPEGFELAMTKAGSGDELVVARSATEALFPAGFAPDGERMYFVSVSSEEGSKLATVDLQSGAVEDIALLASGLTRDWTVSPDASSLAFLEVSFGRDQMISRAYRLDMTTGFLEPVTDAATVAFSPVWSRDGRLAIGAFAPSINGVLVNDAGAVSSIPGPEAGFDVPLAFSPADGGYLVRSFENASVMSPGRSTLTYIGADGQRHLITTEEVTFVGWTDF